MASNSGGSILRASLPFTPYLSASLMFSSIDFFLVFFKKKKKWLYLSVEWCQARGLKSFLGHSNSSNIQMLCSYGVNWQGIKCTNVSSWHPTARCPQFVLQGCSLVDNLVLLLCAICWGIWAVVNSKDLGLDLVDIPRLWLLSLWCWSRFTLCLLVSSLVTWK